MTGLFLCNSTVRIEDLALLSINEKPNFFSLLEFDFMLLIQDSGIIVFRCSLLTLLILFFHMLILFIMSLDNSSNPTYLDCSPAIYDTAFDILNDGDLLDFVCSSQAARNIPKRS